MPTYITKKISQLNYVTPRKNKNKEGILIKFEYCTYRMFGILSTVLGMKLKIILFTIKLQANELFLKYIYDFYLG